MSLILKPSVTDRELDERNIAKCRNGHAKPKSVAFLRLDTAGRVRVGHMLTLLQISHSTLYKRMETGRLPKPDGKDTRPYWHTSTVRALVGK